MLENIEDIFADARSMMKKLNKKTYEERMNAFMQDNGHYYDEMFEYIDSVDNVQTAMEEAADAFIEHLKGKYSNKKGRIPGPKRADIDQILIFFFFPGLLKTEYEKKKDLADVICTRWDDAVGSNIIYTDYQTLYNGFRDRLLGLFRMPG